LWFFASGVRMNEQQTSKHERPATKHVSPTRNLE